MKHTLVFHLIGLSKKLQRVIGFKSQTTPLSYSQTAAMMVIDSHNKPSQAEIARKLHLQPASVVTLIDELEKLKLAKRYTQSNNRRAYNVQLTELGSSQMKKIKKQSLVVETFLKNQLSKDEYQQFSTIIDKLSEGLGENQLNLPSKIKPEGGET